MKSGNPKTPTRSRDYASVKDCVFVYDLGEEKWAYKNPAAEAFLTQDTLPPFEKRYLACASFEQTLDEHLCRVTSLHPLSTRKGNGHSNKLRKAVFDVESILCTELQGHYLFQHGERSYHASLIDTLARSAMDYYGCKTAQLIRLGTTGASNSVLFIYNKGKKLPEATTIHLENELNDPYAAFFSRGYAIYCEDMSRDLAFDKTQLPLFAKKKVRSALVIPFFVEGKLGGVFILANPRFARDDMDFFLADYATNAIGMMVYRERLYYKLYIDEVTDLPWDSSIGLFYPEYVSSHPELPITMFVFDFVRFRMVIRTYGRDMGNRIMSKTAEILRKLYPESLLARKNGTDVFLVVTTGVAESMVIEADRIHKEIQAAFPDIMMTMAFGIYQARDGEESFDNASLKTSLALRHAKDDPFNRIVVYDEKMDQAETLSIHFANRFRPCLENGDFLIYIQPKYDLATNTYFGGEALVRWHLDDQIILPGSFMPQFEANGLARELDIYVLRKTCDIVAKWLRESPDMAVPISVNFSRADFADPDLFETVLYTIKESGVPPKYIEIEITESAYVDYERQISSFIAKCHAAGMHVLMDDFGSGVSSFNSLKNLDIDGIKLDYRFLSHEGDNRKKRKIIEGIVAVTRSIHLPMVIEGVETKTEAAFFRAMGVHYVQGYLFGKPMPVEQFEQLRNLRSTEHTFEAGEDLRMMLNELLDTNSNLNFLFDTINMPSGVFRFDGEGLYPVLVNKKLEQSIASLGNVTAFLQRDLLTFFDEDRRESIKACLAESHRTYVFSNRKTYEFHFGDRVIPVQMQGLFLQRDPSGARFYLLMAEGIDVDPGPDESEASGTQSLKWLLSSKFQGCAIVDADGTILIHNDFLLRCYPDVTVGKKALDVFGQAFEDSVNIHRTYLASRGIVLNVVSRPITYKRKKATLLTFYELGDPGSYISEMAGDGFKYYDRLVATLHTVAVCYVEIDLESDSFFQINFKGHDDFAYHDAVNRGSYTGDLYQRFLTAIDENDLAEIKDELSLPKLIDASKAMSPFCYAYKLKEGMVYHRMNASFYYDKGHHYVCFFLEDITKERVRDYDQLTSCYSRSAGIRLMESYLSEHPIEKTAFFIFDIDDFKTLNDTYGHPLGDRVLGRIHEAFKSLPESYRFLTRLGGDEFCFLAADRGEGFDVEAARTQIEDSMRNIGYQAGLNKPISVSVGCALLPENGSTVHSVYPKADGDLYDQKKNHKSMKNKKGRLW